MVRPDGNDQLEERAAPVLRRAVPLVFAVVVAIAALVVVVRSTAGLTCPVTVVSGEAFVPPEPWPATPADPTMDWYGTEALWRPIAQQGDVIGKSVWWSAEFGGGSIEEMPEIDVVYQRLDVEAPSVWFPAPGTNAHTAEDGSFMISGFEPDEPGCWRGTATYKGATLSYVYRAR